MRIKLIYHQLARLKKSLGIALRNNKIEDAKEIIELIGYRLGELKNELEKI